MKLIRYGEPGQERPGILHNGTYYDTSSVVFDYDTNFFSNTAGINSISTALANEELQPVAVRRLGAPVHQPGKIICIGLNYKKHAEESGMALPTEPVIFFKATSAIIGPNDTVVIPKNSTKTDWEVELAVVIGKKASYVSVEDAPKHIAGYLLHNDLSERAFQLEKGGQWVKGKSCDTFAPLGPWVATPSEVEDAQNLNLWLEVNGKKVQNSSTNDMLFSIPFLVSYLSQFMSLQPGDIISTGTPEGVGLGFDPPIYLKPGDTMRLGIDGLGVAEQKVVAFTK